MKILHIVHDEKFIDIACRVFEAENPDNNTYVIISQPFQLKFIKHTQIQFVGKHNIFNNNFVSSLTKFDIVILHCMDDIMMQLVARADADVNFVWIGWGVDYYDLITGDTTKLLLPKTLSKERPVGHNKSLSLFVGKIRSFIKPLFYRSVNKTEIVNRINFFAPVLYNDFELVKSALPGFKPHYLSWNYGSLEDDFIKGFEDVTAIGNNILIGNSASPTNNHLDVFDEFAGIELKNRKIICPLNYGISNYRDIVSYEGLQRFQGTFVPIIDFMPSYEYTKLLSSCSIAVMGHLRQQAMGNIIIMLYIGAKVFLYKENPIYSFFKEEGALIYSMDELKNEYMEKLSTSAILQNRDVLQKHWGRDAISEKTRNLIETAMFGVTYEVQ
jgi:hypothetical protein